MYNEYRKSAYLPSLEVKVHAPDLFQPKVQAVIQELEEKRELKEKRLLKQLETAYNQELLSSSQEISNVIKESLSIFDNDNLLQKSIEFAITPPIVLLSETAQEKIKRNNKRLKELMKTPFVAEHQLNKIAETVPLPIEDIKAEKMTGSDRLDVLDTNIPFDNNDIHFKQKDKEDNGPIDIDHIYSYFLQVNDGGKNEGKYTKPIFVEMKLPNDPDPKIKKEIEKMENKRDGFEEKLFKQANEEFKLITKITIKELQSNLKHELLPFYVLSKGTMQNIDSVISQNVRKNQRFLQLDKSQFESDYKDLISQNKIEHNNLNTLIQSKLMNIFSSFIESSASNNIEDFINVKFVASDQSYPTIEKLVAQMMTRRDLSEKYIRLKILEYESRLQKAENEMIQDILHETLYKIIAKYAPAIEGIREHIK